MARNVSGSPVLLKIGALCGFSAWVVVACATGGSRIETSDDGNLTETTTTGGTGGAGGMGGALITSSSTTTTTGSGGGGGAGGEDLMCDEDPCKVMAPQCGCPSDEKCTLLPGIYTRGCRDAGSALHGETCGSDTDCAAGTYCLNLAGHRVCRDYCETDADCAAPGGQCQLELGLNQGPEKWCSDNCDPITNAGCAVAGSKCELLRDDQDAWYTICVAAGVGTEGASCSGLNDCAAGYGCLTVNSVSSCHQYCDVDNPVCSTGTCINFEAPEPVIGTKTYGGCN